MRHVYEGLLNRVPSPCRSPCFLGLGASATYFAHVLTSGLPTQSDEPSSQVLVFVEFVGHSLVTCTLYQACVLSMFGRQVVSTFIMYTSFKAGNPMIINTEGLIFSDFADYSTN